MTASSYSPSATTAPRTAKPRARWLSLVDTADSRTALFMRLVLGLVMFPHGAQKVLGWFGGYGFALLAIAAEFLGSIGLIVGLLSRVAAFGIACVMIVAVMTTHFANGFFMNWNGNQKGEGFEYHILAIAIAIFIMIKGSGKASIDRAVALGTRQ